MKLLEYQVGKFYDDCLYSEIEKHECSEKGYKLAKLIARGMEFWLKSKDCTVEDFIKAVYDENVEKEITSESDLFEILARFLCGYDVYTNYENLDLIGKVESKISNEDLSKKVNFIKKCL